MCLDPILEEPSPPSEVGSNIEYARHSTEHEFSGMAEIDDIKVVDAAAEVAPTPPRTPCSGYSTSAAVFSNETNAHDWPVFASVAEHHGTSPGRIVSPYFALTPESRTHSAVKTL